MTLLEVMVVLAIVVLLMIAGTRVLRDVRHSDLREQSMMVLATLRRAADLAASTGTHQRVVFDLDTQKLRVETCIKPVRLQESDEEEEKLSEDDLKDLKDRVRQSGQSSEQLAEVLEAVTPDDAMAAAAALAGVRIGSSQCESQGEGQIRVDLEIRVRKIYVQHLEDGVAEGEVSINFFPLGYAEKAIVEVVDKEGTTFSLLVHGVTGRVELEAGALDDPEDHMMRDGLGEDVAER